MISGPLRVDRSADGVVVLTLDLPDRRNAMTEEMTAAWGAAIGDVRADSSVRALLVTGAGSAFCAGADLSWLGVGSGLSVDALRSRMLPFYRTWLSIRDLDVPTVAAINGPAVGAGLALALACDLRYAAPEATLSVPFTTLGIHAGMATTWLLPEVAGLPVARELLLTGRVVTGEEAVGMGLVNRVFPGEGLLHAAVAVTRSIAAKAPVATRLTTTALREGHRSMADALRWEALAQPVTMATDDLAEGLAAQRERRPPRFTGR
ncbi:MAG: enoyl-CoA hydratase [Pseudonocardiales bacterium]|nr:MAG: enoyl-CoA hydratase [Pseudonocardiales bacterium]